MTLKELVEQKEILHQEILTLCHLSTKATSSEEFMQCQEALSRKKIFLATLENRIQTSLNISISKPAFYYPKEEK